jgi:serine/threonine protein phosphatase PrpC
MLEDSEIAWLLMESTTQPLPVACQRLISEANDRGGLDNITVMLLRVGAA